MSEVKFERENRYYVIKRSDLAKMSPVDCDLAQSYLLHLDSMLSSWGAPERHCVVIESDWPEYEPVWKAIESRVTGRPSDVHIYNAQTIFSAGGSKLEYFPKGPKVVMVEDFDAQRLRADTAEAERDVLKKALESAELEVDTKNEEIALSDQYATYQDERVAAAEQRIAGMSVILSRIIEVQKTDYSIRGGLPHRWECLIAEAYAALNPNPEAESHEKH